MWCEQCDAEECKGCGKDCGCDTHAEHKDAIEESRNADGLGGAGAS